MPLWVKLLIAGLGLVFLAVGLFVGLFGAPSANAEADRVAALTPIGLTQLEDLPAGQEVLVEGLLSARNRAIFREFVAYSISAYQGLDDDGDAIFEEVDRETPRLLIEAGGLVQIGNTDYAIEGDQVIWRAKAGPVEADPGEEATLIYSGLAPLQPVTAVGSVVVGPEGNELRARTIFGGSRADYVAARRGDTVFLTLFGAGFALVGLGLSGGAIWSMLRPRRRGKPGGTIV